jgi:hypothetical protein
MRGGNCLFLSPNIPEKSPLSDEALDSTRSRESEGECAIDACNRDDSKRRERKKQIKQFLI